MASKICASDIKSIISLAESNNCSVFRCRQTLKANIRDISVVSIFNRSLNQSCIKVSFNYINRYYRSVSCIVINCIVDSAVDIHIYYRSSLVNSECLTLNNFIDITRVIHCVEHQCNIVIVFIKNKRFSDFSYKIYVFICYDPSVAYLGIYLNTCPVDFKNSSLKSVDFGSLIVAYFSDTRFGIGYCYCYSNIISKELVSVCIAVSAVADSGNIYFRGISSATKAFGVSSSE